MRARLRWLKFLASAAFASSAALAVPPVQLHRMVGTQRLHHCKRQFFSVYFQHGTPNGKFRQLQ
jgi:hypothetical protein